ncbi:carbonic anhydrase family protein [Paludisphaera soli]|uniref:carbonic anhydrase family protein n=1 Tax=Paludisphaera soli TaxID=2712865 RepID=UPI0013EC5E7F|nr:carbonic anhydrase family protein [Paludisphaera soli]
MSFAILPQQSPIDLGYAQPLTYRFPAGYFSFNWDAQETGHIVEGPHGKHISFTNSVSHADLILPGATSPTRFQMAQFHFHSLSEHRVNGHRWPLELHVVHTAIEPDPWSSGKDRTIYLVVGIFLDRQKADGKKDEAAEKFFRGLTERLAEKEADDSKAWRAPDPVRPRDLLPADPTAYWRYEGSLTSNVHAPNGGYVSWIVLEEVKLIDGTVLDDYIARLKHEAKVPQELDRRFVLHNPKAGGATA